MNRSVLILISRDFLVVLAIGILSLGGGLILNKMKEKPIPLHYLSVQERLDSDLNKILKDQTVSTSFVEPKTVSLEEVKKLQDQRNTLFLDARAKLFYDLGHLPSAHSLPRQDFLNAFKQVKPILDAQPDQALVVYCSGGSCKDSDLVARALTRLGYKNIYQYRGGWEEWSSSK